MLSYNKYIKLKMKLSTRKLREYLMERFRQQQQQLLKFYESLQVDTIKCTHHFTHFSLPQPLSLSHDFSHFDSWLLHDEKCYGLQKLYDEILY